MNSNGCPGLHCPGCGHGGGAGAGLGAGLAGLVVLAVLWHYAGAILGTLTEILTVAAGITGGLVVLSGAGLAVVLIRNRGRTSIPRPSRPALRPWDRPTIRGEIVSPDESRELPAGPVPGESLSHHWQRAPLPKREHKSRRQPR